MSTMMAILWEDEKGQEEMVQARLIDVSVSGAKLWLPTKLPLRAVVTFNCLAQCLGGRGTVRYCNTSKGGYVIGLEMSGGTGWQDQNLDLRNLAASLKRANQASAAGDAVAETVDVPLKIPD